MVRLRSTTFLQWIFYLRVKIHFIWSISIWFNLQTGISRHPMFKKGEISNHPWECPHLCLRTAVHVQAHGCVLLETDFLANWGFWRFLSSDIPSWDTLSNFDGHNICFCLVSWPKSVREPRFCSRSSWVMRSCSVHSSWPFSTRSTFSSVQGMSISLYFH